MNNTKYLGNKEYILERLEQIENDLASLSLVIPNAENQNQFIIDRFGIVHQSLNRLQSIFKDKTKWKHSIQ